MNFAILHGESKNLPSATGGENGTCYFCTDTKQLYIYLNDELHLINGYGFKEFEINEDTKIVADSVEDVLKMVSSGSMNISYDEENNVLSFSVTVDSALSSSSTNPVQNSIIKTALDNKVDKVDGKGLSTNDYTSVEKSKLSTTNIVYATCGTAASTQAKVASIVTNGNTNWSLAAGSIVVVKFTNTNTASNPTLNVNNTGAKSIVYNTSVITTSNLGYAGAAGRYIQYMYDGTNYVFIGWSYDLDTNTQYSIVSASGTSAGLMSVSDKNKLDGISTEANKASFTQTQTSGTEIGKLTFLNGTTSTTQSVYIPTPYTPITKTATLSATWSSTTQSVAVTGMTTSKYAIVGLDTTASVSDPAEMRTQAAKAKLYVASQGEDTISIGYEGEKPTVTIPIVIVIF